MPNADGESYGEIFWLMPDVPDSTVMTANTIVGNITLGVYSTEGTEPDIQTYTAAFPNIPEPSTWALLGIGAIESLYIRRRTIVRP